MIEVGIALSSEEHGPRELVEQAVKAEAAGFRTVAVSDHFHPWVSAQGQSPFVWSVIGGIAARTTSLRVGTAVTCPIIRTHPAVVAQAAATSAVMLEGRFFLGIGTGENLNEHVTGAKWPVIEERLEMLEESVDVMRLLFTGGNVDYRGKHYLLENAKLFTVPDGDIPIYVSAFGPKATEVATRIGDGYIGTSPDREVLDTFSQLAPGKPKLAYTKVCWGTDEQAQAELMHRIWPTSGIPGQLSQELATVDLFEAAASLVTMEQSTTAPHGPDVEKYVDFVQSYAEAGYDTVCLHQIGPDLDGFLGFWERELAPALKGVARVG